MVAGDVRAARVALLAATLRRGRADRARVVHLDPEAPLPFAARRSTSWWWTRRAAGSAPLRRDPDIRWRRTAADLPRFAAAQLDLSAAAAAARRPGGRLVYTHVFERARGERGGRGRALEALPEFRSRTTRRRRTWRHMSAATAVPDAAGPRRPRRLLRRRARARRPAVGARASPCNTVVDRAWPFGRECGRSAGWWCIGGALAATFLIFAAIAVRVAVRAREVTVPDLDRGQPGGRRRARSAQQQLSLRVDDRAAAQYPRCRPGRVLGQDPRPGTSSRRQRSVRVWVSAGPRIVAQPGLVGETERSARIRLSQEGLDATSVAEIRSEAFAARSGRRAGSAAGPAGRGGAAAGQPRRGRGRLRDARPHRRGRRAGRGDPAPAGVPGRASSPSRSAAGCRRA